jgi:hypothetical protein
MATRTYNTRSFGSSHYTRRVSLGEQIKNRAWCVAAGAIGCEALHIALPIFVH